MLKVNWNRDPLKTLVCRLRLETHRGRFISYHLLQNSLNRMAIKIICNVSFFIYFIFVLFEY